MAEHSVSNSRPLSRPASTQGLNYHNSETGPYQTTHTHLNHSNNNLQRSSSIDHTIPSNGNIFLLRLKSIMVYSFPLAVYIITSGEFAMLIFYQFYFYDYDSNLLGLSVFLQIICLLYFMTMFIYMFYSINYRY